MRGEKEEREGGESKRVQDRGCRTEDGKQRSEDVEGGGGRSMGVINTTSTPTSHGSNKDGSGRREDAILEKPALEQLLLAAKVRPTGNTPG